MSAPLFSSYSIRQRSKINTVLIVRNWVFGLCCVLHMSFANTLDEYTVKVALVRNFAVFTQWPESVFIHAHDTMNLCVLGDNVVQQAFSQLEDKLVAGRVLNVIDINKRLNLTRCHIIFIGSKDRVQLSQVHAAVSGKPILTIDDMTGVSTYTGIVNLQMDDGKMRLNINLDIARQSQLKISSRLLKLAVIVSAKTGIE